MPIRAEQLNSFHLFRGLDDDNAAAICSRLATKEFAEGEVILHEGECVQALWIILSGECDVLRTHSDGQEHVLATLNAGDVFGEMSFVRNAPHSASIRACRSVSVCFFRRDDFCELAEERPAAAYRITSNVAAVLAERLHRMDTWVCELVDRPDDIDYKDEWQKFCSAVSANWNL